MTTFDYFTGRMVDDRPNIVNPPPATWDHPKGVHEWKYHLDLQTFDCSICGEPGPDMPKLIFESMMRNVDTTGIHELARQSIAASQRQSVAASQVRPPATVWVALVTYTKTRAVQIRSNAAVQPLGQGIGRMGIFDAAPQVTAEETMAAEILAVCPDRGFAEIASEAHQRAHPELANLAVWSISEHQVGLPVIDATPPDPNPTRTCIGPGCTTELRGQDARCSQCQKKYYDECRNADPFFAQTMEEATAERDRLARRTP